jgi:hypothetical protein
MEPKGSLPHLQEPATCPYPEPDRSSPCSLPSSLRYILILSSFLHLGLPSGLLHSGFPTEIQYALVLPPHVLHALPRPLFMNRSIFYCEDLLAPRPSPKLENRPMSAVRDCLFNIFAATLHNCRPFLHPQPEDAPCCGDRDPLITVRYLTHIINPKGYTVTEAGQDSSEIYWTRLPPAEQLSLTASTP